MKGRIKQLGIGIGAILMGFAEYLVYRPWGNGKGTLIDLPVRLIDSDGNIEKYLHSIPNYFGNIHGWMPNYIGTLGGSLLAIGLSNAKTKAQQFSQIAQVSGVFLLGEIGQYFGVIPGTYDTKDVLAYLGGAVTAWSIARLTTKKDSLEDKVTLSQTIDNMAESPKPHQ